ncbi:MAG: FkbM family methyltransferase [Thermoguttaceae bacterium]
MCFAIPPGPHRPLRRAADLGHTRVDILKIDIEGGEMAALKEMLSSRTLEKLSVEQLLVEFHFWDDEHWSAFVQILGLLRDQGYLLFRKEFNLSNSSCAEFAFLRSE